MESVPRRALLKQGAVLAGAALIAPSALVRRARAAVAGYGPLAPVGEGHLALPAGFSYHVVDEAGVDEMADGSLLPGAPDGHAFFPHPTNRKLWRVVRNHELGAGAALGDTDLAYDVAAEGSVIAYDMDPATVMPVQGSHHVVASGLVWPCSGGATPRKTWLSCEEATSLSGPVGLTRKQGYVFEIPSAGGGQLELSQEQPPQRLTQMGGSSTRPRSPTPRPGSCT